MLADTKKLRSSNKKRDQSLECKNETTIVTEGQIEKGKYTNYHYGGRMELLPEENVHFFLTREMNIHTSYAKLTVPNNIFPLILTST